MQLQSLQTKYGMTSYFANAYQQRNAPDATDAVMQEEERVEEASDKTGSRDTDTFVRSGAEATLESSPISLRPMWRSLNVYDRLTEMLREIGPPLDEDAETENAAETPAA